MLEEGILLCGTRHAMVQVRGWAFARLQGLLELTHKGDVSPHFQSQQAQGWAHPIHEPHRMTKLMSLLMAESLESNLLQTNHRGGVLL